MSEKIVQLNEEVIKGQIKKLVRGSVEENDSGIFNGIRYCICYNKPYYNMNDLAEYFGIENKSFHLEEAEDYSYRWIIKEESETK